MSCIQISFQPLGFPSLHQYPNSVQGDGYYFRLQLADIAVITNMCHCGRRAVAYRNSRTLVTFPFRHRLVTPPPNPSAAAPAFSRRFPGQLLLPPQLTPFSAVTGEAAGKFIRFSANPDTQRAGWSWDGVVWVRLEEEPLGQTYCDIRHSSRNRFISMR